MQLRMFQQGSLTNSQKSSKFKYREGSYSLTKINVLKFCEILNLKPFYVNHKTQTTSPKKTVQRGNALKLYIKVNSIMDEAHNYEFFH